MWLCGDKNGTIKHILSECSKLAQKEYKTRHDWIERVINWELCKKFKLSICAQLRSCSGEVVWRQSKQLHCQDWPEY